jgi:kinesin family protein 12
MEQEIDESVRVCVRIRPLNEKEQTNGDTSCISIVNPQALQIQLKGASKTFRFHAVLGEEYTQAHTFTDSAMPILLDSALDGYSASVFAYGQTGSGKTYTMAGLEDNLGRADYKSDETDGIIPRAITYLWQSMVNRNDQYYVKAAFMEIYNEQVRDLLNPASGVLHCRWNMKQGFFVEDLLVVDCTNIDDLIAVLHEGNRNRKTGSHELNKDSSRSHSIMLVYLISETKTEDGPSFKKYGKVCFVDLAGSERLKETKSQGTMLKETGNINKSLFNLGKVISALGDKKKQGRSHIPYRDSKLTMLLMDSLGGTAKAIMVACVTPAATYCEETLSTLSYASRTMNIKNKPIVQMDSKAQIIYNFRREIELLKLENEYLKEQLYRVTGGLPPARLDIAPRGNSAKSSNGKLPPIPNPPHASQTAQQMVNEYKGEIERLKLENSQLSNGREILERLSNSVVVENQTLTGKLQHLENVFTDVNPVEESSSVMNANSYTISNVTVYSATQ